MINPSTQLSILGLMFAALFPFATLSHETQGQSPAVIAKISQYYESGQYIKDIEQKLEHPTKLLKENAARLPTQPLAVVIDVDDTALSNYHNLKRMHFTNNKEAYTGAYLLGDLPPLEPVFQFYQQALALNYNVFFVTGRPSTPEIRAATVMNLKRAGYIDWEELYMRPTDQDHIPVNQFKAGARKSIHQQGFEIIVNIGDQENDVQGGYATCQIKLPNPFYTITS